MLNFSVRIFYGHAIRESTLIATGKITDDYTVSDWYSYCRLVFLNLDTAENNVFVLLRWQIGHGLRYTMAVLRCGRARGAVVPLDMSNFFHSGKNIFPRSLNFSEV
jgi:hypothetical protein